MAPSYYFLISLAFFLMSLACFGASALLILLKPAAWVSTLLFMLWLGVICLFPVGYFQHKELKKRNEGKNVIEEGRDHTDDLVEPQEAQPSPGSAESCNRGISQMDL